MRVVFVGNNPHPTVLWGRGQRRNYECGSIGKRNLHVKVEHWATAKLVEKNKKIRLASAKKTIEELEKAQ